METVVIDNYMWNGVVSNNETEPLSFYLATTTPLHHSKIRDIEMERTQKRKLEVAAYHLREAKSMLEWLCALETPWRRILCHIEDAGAELDIGWNRKTIECDLCDGLGDLHGRNGVHKCPQCNAGVLYESNTGLVGYVE